MEGLLLKVLQQSPSHVSIHREYLLELVLLAKVVLKIKWAVKKMQFSRLL